MKREYLPRGCFVLVGCGKMLYTSLSMELYCEGYNKIKEETNQEFCHVVVFFHVGRGKMLCTRVAFELYCEGYEKIKGVEPRVHRATDVCMNIHICGVVC